jgi:hypothetical protein
MYYIYLDVSCRTILLDLATVGEIYTTIDEDHYKAT